MKINKNILMEYLYLTIFVITLFVLKELIEYVFFTRKRNNIIEKFSDDACGKISWYHDNYDNILKIFEMFNYSGDVLDTVTIPVDQYVEFKSVQTEEGSRIVIEPKNNAIYFENFTWIGNLAATSTAATSTAASTQRCIVIRVHNVPESGDGPSKNYLDFASYSSYTSVPFYADNTSTFTAPTNPTVFARFDIDTEYNEELNVKINDLLQQHTQ